MRRLGFPISQALVESRARPARQPGGRHARRGHANWMPRPRRAARSASAAARPHRLGPHRRRMTHVFSLISPRHPPGAFLVVLGVLVFVHELGHYLAARWRGVHVETFSIGFGRALLSWTDRVGTVWKLAWIPLGGYVKLHGQERPEDVSARGARLLAAGPHLPRQARAVARHRRGGRADRQLPARRRAVRRPVRDRRAGRSACRSSARSWPRAPPPRPGCSAGDRVISIDGTPVRRFEDLQRIVAAQPGQAAAVRVLRDGHEQTLTACQTASREGALGQPHGRARHPGRRGRVQPARPALGRSGAGIAQTWDVTVQTRRRDSAQMLSGQRNADELSGPLAHRPALRPGRLARLRRSLISFIAVLSVNLGLINLFPIPVLDGGHLLFYVGGGDSRPAGAAAGAGIRVPRRIRRAGRAVRLRDLERPVASRPVPLGRLLG